MKLTDEQFKAIVAENPEAKFKIISTVYKFRPYEDYKGICSYLKGAEVGCHGDYIMQVDGYPYPLSFLAEELEPIGGYVEETIKVKFPCVVPMAEIKNQETFDKIFDLFIANGADSCEADYEEKLDYRFFGVDCDEDTMFYSGVNSYSLNEEEDEVTVYSVAELLAMLTKEEVNATPVTTLFPIGTEVQIAKDSQYYKEGDHANPINTKGVLVRNTPVHEGDEYIYRVQWDECQFNSYKLNDLVLWEETAPVASQEAITERLEDNPSVGIDYSVMGSTASTEPLITVTQEVKYTVVIRGITFTFTQDELDALTEELLGFTTL